MTGAGSGIGRAIAKAFLDRGDIVHIGDVSAERLEDAAADLNASGHLRPHQLDVSDADQMRRFAEAASEPTGRLDVFVNNAGVFDGYAGVDETTPQLWRRVIEVNLTGCFHGCRAAAELMTRQQSGRIVNIGSVAGQRGAADGLAYAASKAGIEGMTRRLAVDLARHGVTANVVAPGVTSTDIRKNSAEVLGDLVDMNRGIGASKDVMDFLIPAGRAGQPSEVAAAVVFLASDEAAYITGHTLHVDGGWNAT
ncbi:MAG: SDR family NAD(P)-dependent oxidoreductase [Micromonosporaceae bacterium]